MAAAQADRANHLALELDWKSTAKDGQAWRVRDAVQEWRIVLDEVEPGVRRHGKRRGRVGLVVRDVDRKLRRAVHAEESLDIAGLVGDGDAHLEFEFGRLLCRRRDRLLSCFGVNAVLNNAHAVSSP